MGDHPCRRLDRQIHHDHDRITRPSVIQILDNDKKENVSDASCLFCVIMNMS